MTTGQNNNFYVKSSRLTRNLINIKRKGNYVKVACGPITTWLNGIYFEIPQLFPCVALGKIFLEIGKWFYYCLCLRKCS